MEGLFKIAAKQDVNNLGFLVQSTAKMNNSLNFNVEITVIINVKSMEDSFVDLEFLHLANVVFIAIVLMEFVKKELLLT